MTREEAIDVLITHKKILIDNVTSELDENDIEALDIAIKALDQEPCEDAISRKATVKRLCKIADYMNEKRNGLGSPYVMAALFIQDNKDEFPSVQTKPKTGKWLTQKGIFEIVCSACMKGYHYHPKEFNFCPNCGADMRGEEK